MALSSPRADNLAFIRDILVLIRKGDIKDQRSFDTYLADNKQWKKSRRYHYLSALRDLHFIEKENGCIELGAAGRTAVEIGSDNFGYIDASVSALSEAEKAFMRQHLLQYDPFVDFLSLFIPENTGRSVDYSTFLERGRAIGLEFRKEEEGQGVRGPSAREALLSGWRIIVPDGTIRHLSRTEHRATMWTLKYWARSLDLIDELWIPEFRQYPDRFEKAMFPVKVKEDEIAIDAFRALLDALLARQKYISSYIPIPILLHDFCTTYFVKVKTFLRSLCLLHFRLPGEYYLDKVSRAYIDERCHWIGKRRIPEEGRYQRNYTNYPRIDDFFSSHLIIRRNGR